MVDPFVLSTYQFAVCRSFPLKSWSLEILGHDHLLGDIS